MRTRGKLHLLGATGAMALVVTLSGCSGTDSSSSSATTAFGANVTRPPASSPVSTLPDTAGLAAYVPQVGGLSVASGANVDNGPFDLNAAVRKYASNDAEARRRLTEDGFSGGYASTFRGDGNSAAGVQLYKFKDQAAANDFAEYLKEHAMQGVINFNLSVNGIPDLTGFVQPQVNQGRPTPGSLSGALFVKGPYLAYVGASSPSTDVAGIMQTLTKAQYDALPST